MERTSLYLVLVLAASVPCGAGEYSWQKRHAKVLPAGDLEWAPEPFVFEKGKSVRYIDYENGDDKNDGASKETPWKHHPWDKAFRGRKGRDSGVDTYVFKRGTAYRGSLSAYVVGRPAAPIRLTSDPGWGEGEACIYGSELVTGWKQGVGHPDIPGGEQVWYADIRFKTRGLWMVDRDGSITRIRLARTPNWSVSDPDDVMSEWWSWQNREWWKDGMKNRQHLIKNDRGKTLQLGIDPKHITRDPAYYEGAIVWTEWGIVMGSPYPRLVEKVLPERHALAFNGPFYGIWGLFAGHRYFLEDKPHYLDGPGEYWFEPRGRGGRVYLRLPGDRDPNKVAIEAACRRVLIDSDGMRHVRISGLTFRFTNYWWQLWAYPFGHKDAQGCACIRVLGSGDDIRISHCRFEHVNRAIRMAAGKDGNRLDRIRVTDCEIRYADHSGVWIRADFPEATLGRVDFLRNRLHEITLRAQNNIHCHAVYIQMVETGEFAGNFLDRLHAGGLFLEVAKSDKDAGEVPLARVLVHHNKVVDPLLKACDWGGIEVNQGGPAYIYNNVVGNPGGFSHWKWANRDPKEKPKGTPRFGHAYYIDGSFKKYLFNNIAWGKNNTIGSKYANCSGLQEIIGFENTVFNNTFYQLVQASRRQTPQAGRNKYLGNVFEDVSQFVFRHSDDKQKDPNVQDAGEPAKLFAYESLAYANNVLHDISGQIGMFEADGTRHDTVESFAEALRKRSALASSFGLMAEKPPLQDPSRHDFRPRPDGPAVDRGVTVFVPWGLAAVVGEWHFTRNNEDPSCVIDEHWFMTSYYGPRTTYKDTPRYPLEAVNVEAGDYVRGPLEDWTEGALTFNGKDQFARIHGKVLTQPVTMVSNSVKSKGGITRKTRVETTFAPELLRTVDVSTGNLLIEVYFRTEPGRTNGVLVSKEADRGYELCVGPSGRVAFLLHADGEVRVDSKNTVSDGRWHHVVAELDRGASRARIYVDGKLAGEAGATLGGSLANDADFLVGRGGDRFFAGTIDFLRVARGTLADAKTTIEELHAWQFDGPFLRDFAGRAPTGKGRDAGALEAR